MKNICSKYSFDTVATTASTGENMARKTSKPQSFYANNSFHGDLLSSTFCL